MYKILRVEVFFPILSHFILSLCVVKMEADGETFEIKLPFSHTTGGTWKAAV